MIHASLVMMTLAQDTGATGTPAPGPRTLLEYLHAGGPVAYILLVLSVAAVALIVTNLVILRREYLAPPRVVEGLERLMQQRQPDLAVQYARQRENDCFLARVLAGGLVRASRSPMGMLELKPAIEEQGARELDRIDRVTHGLRVLADLGPMLGLLGTVIGIVGAFAAIGSAEGAGRSAQLAGHMSEALVNTALGLSVAIPSLVAHAFFRRRLDALAAQVGDVIERLLAELHTSKSGPKPSPRGAPPAGNGAQPAPQSAQPASGAGA